LEQSYRWKGVLKKEHLYLGTSLPTDLDRFKHDLDRDIWHKTWFREFDGIRAGYQRRLKVVPKSVIAKERRAFIVEFTYNTNRIEGSTLTLGDTRLLLDRGQVRATRRVQDIVETRQHAALIERLIENPEPVDLSHILDWHRELLGQTEPELAGKIREYRVDIGQSKHKPPPPEEVKPRLSELLSWTKRTEKDRHPVERAGEFHWRFESIHPFGDGNGRVGRIAMNLLLAELGYPMLDVPYIRRQGYYNALEEADLKSDARPFLLWFFLRYSRDHRFYLEEERGPAD
jgi:Fic family protein